jgi:phage shock protein A
MDRIKRMAKGNLIELLDKVDKPELELKGHIRELEEHLQAAKEAVAEFAVTHKKNEKEFEQHKRMQDEWQYKAEASLKAGDEALAKRAIGERIKLEERIKRLEPSLVSSSKTYAQLRQQVIELGDNLKTARTTLVELQSRDRAAKAQQKFGSHIDAASPKGSIDFSRFEDVILQKEAEVEIEREMRGEMTAIEDRLDQQSVAVRVERELGALKRQVAAPQA